MSTPSLAPICPYCGKGSAFITSSELIYNGRDYGPLYVCWTCDAYVSVHEGTRNPKGTLANKLLRQARRATHAVLDVLWEDLQPAYPEVAAPWPALRAVARTRAYTWLAAQLGIPFDDCHVAMFDLARCALAIQAITAHQPTSATVRQWFKSQPQRAA